MKNLKVLVLCLASITWSQDVILESDTDEFHQLEVQNTEPYDKVAISGTSAGEANAGSNIGVSGVGINFSGVGAQAIGIYGLAWAYNGAPWAGFFDGYVQGWDFIATSDLSAKENVRPLTPTLDKVMQLEPKTYRLTQAYTRQKKDSPETIGLIAQELESVFPQLVKNFSRPAVDENGRINPKAEAQNLKGVNYDGMIPVLIKAIQEQQAQIEALKRQIGAGRE